MAVTYKDISLLSQKATIAGTEKIPVSGTQYITPDQIVGRKIPSVSSSDKQKLLAIDDNGNIVATFSVGGQGLSHLISNLQTLLLVGFDYNDFSFIKPSDVNTTLQDALDAKPDVYSGSSAPSSSLGKNGDIYIQTS